MSRRCTCDGTPGQYCVWCAPYAARVGLMTSVTQITPASASLAKPSSKKPHGSHEDGAIATFFPTHDPTDADTLKTAASGLKQVSPDRYRSKTERRYAALLEQERQQGIIRAWYYEPLKGLYLAPKTSYTPDFLVELPWHGPGDTGFLCFHEIKGPFIREKDWIKVKLAAAVYPCFRFLLVQWKENRWQWKEVPAI